MKCDFTCLNLYKSIYEKYNNNKKYKEERREKKTFFFINNKCNKDM